MIGAVAVISLLIAVPAFASEAWFLPYEPDEDTLVLLHLDQPGEEQSNLGIAPVSATLVRGAQIEPGCFRGAALLDGREQFIMLPGDPLLRLRVDQPFTVEMWLRPDSVAGNIFSIGINFYLAAHFERGRASFGYRAASFPIRWYHMSGIPWQRGKWQHVALTHDADRTVRLYLNGRFVAEITHGDEGTYTEKTGNTTFGAHDGWREFLRGAIDEVRVSTRVREFAPLLTEEIYLPGEMVALNLDAVTLPPTVAAVRVRVVDSAGREALARELPVAEASRPLIAAEKLGEGASQIEIAFVDVAGAEIASFKRTVNFAGARLAELQRRAGAIDAALVDAPPELIERSLAEGLVAAARAAIERRDLEGAGGHLAAAERRVAQVVSGEAAYRHAIRRFVRARDDAGVRITMSWDAADAGGALPWAARIGANELVTSHRAVTREGLQLWRDAGYHTVMLSSAPIHTADRARPEQAQFGYWYMDMPPAASATATLKLVAPAWGGLGVSDFFPPARHWLVLDLETGEALPPERWAYDPATKTVTIFGAREGQVFRVYYLNATTGIGDPLYEPFAQHGLAVLEEEVAPLEGVLETFWYDDLAYAWPGGNPQGGYDWESYTNAARPENQRAFTEETGIEFDPRWLVMPPRTLDVPPRPEYLAWMTWVQERIKQWMRRATDMVYEHGMRTWLYWGDCHVGIEPFLGSLEAGNVDEVDKPAGDPVTARALMDFPGEVYRRLRVEWLHAHLVGRADAAEWLAGKWQRARRGLLMQPPSGLYWMPMPNVTSLADEALREDVVEEIAQISDEFRLMAGQLGGTRAWEGGLNLYVVHSWGRQYSWRPWGDRVLWHLTDLPVRVRFISFRDLLEAGVPDDADCLLLYGRPGTAWSGGYIWEDQRLAAAIRAFVHGGGGLIGLQAPSALEERWALADVFGVTGADDFEAQGPGVAYSGDEWIDEAALAQARDQGSAALALATAVPGLEQPPVIAGMQATVTARSVTDDLTVAYALVSDDGVLAPGMTVREVGQGRVVWLAGWSAEYGFSRLLRSAIFWAVGREAEAGVLDVTGGDDLFVYAYPDTRAVALLNAGDEVVEATVRCDRRILGVATDAVVTDVVTGETLGTAAQLAEGLTVIAIPHCVRLLQAERADLRP